MLDVDFIILDALRGYILISRVGYLIKKRWGFAAIFLRDSLSFSEKEPKSSPFIIILYTTSAHTQKKHSQKLRTELRENLFSLEGL